MPSAKVKVNGKFYDIGGLTAAQKQVILDEANEYAEQLRKNMQEEIDDLTNALAGTGEYIDNAFKDGIISEIEERTIRTHIRNIISKKAELDREYLDIFGNVYISLISKATLTAAKINYDDAHNALIEEIENAIADGIGTEGEGALIDARFNEYNAAISLLVSALNSAIEQITDSKDSELENKINDNLEGTIAPINTKILSMESSIEQTAQAITSKVSRTELTTTMGNVRAEAIEASKAYADGLKLASDESLEELTDRIDNTGEYIDNAFKDGIISTLEASTIRTYLNELQTSKDSFDAVYTDLYGNTYLVGNPKNNLLSAKNNLNIAHNALIKAINDAIADDKATPEEALEVNSKFSLYRDSVRVYSLRVNQATDSISKEKALEAQNNAIFTANQYADGLKNQSDQALSNLSDRLEETDEYIDSAFKDGIITAVEVANIKNHLNELNVSKGSFDATYTELYANIYLTGTPKINLFNAKNGLDSAHNALVLAIETAIADGVATPEEATDVNTKFSNYAGSVKLYSQRVSQATDHIAQGKATEAERNANDYTDGELIPVKQTLTRHDSSITQLADEIALKVTREEFDAGLSDANEYADGLKLAIDSDVQDLHDELSSTKGYLDEAFRDGIIYEAEARKIESFLLSLDESKKAMDSRYNSIYNNSILTGTPKTNLASAKTVYNNRYNSLVSTINEVIVDQAVDSIESALVDTKYVEYSNSITLLASTLEAAADAISQARAKKSLDDAKLYTDGIKNSLDTVIGNLDEDIRATEDYVDNAFRDGIVTEEEAKRIKGYINIIDDAKGVYDQKYLEVYNNPDLGSTYKAELGLAKSKYDTAYTNFTSSMLTAIADGKATAAEALDVESKHTLYNIESKNLTAKIEKALDNITRNLADKALNDAKDLIAPIDGRLEIAESSLTTMADAIEARVTKTVFDSVESRVTENEGKITVMSGEINLKVSSTEVQQIRTDLNDSIRIAQETADTAKTSAGEAQDTADTAQTSAGLANSLLSDLASDSKITASEKVSVKKEWDIIVSERASIVAQGAKYSVSTAAYTNAYNALNTYISPILTNLAVTTNIVGTTFRNTFKAYYDAKVALLKSITDKAKDLADGAQATADDLKNNVVPAVTERVRVAEQKITAEAITSTVSSSETWATQTNAIANAKKAGDDAQASANSAATAASAAQTAANTAKTTADNAVASASSANSLITDIASDSRLTAVEKKSIKKEWDIIVSERASIVAQGATYALSTTAYTNSYNTLNTYITPMLVDLNTTSTIVGATFRTNFKNYYDAKLLLLKAITDKAKSLADTAQGVADEAKATADTLKNTTVPNLASRVQTAEQKITAEAITNTVSSSEVWNTQAGAIAAIQTSANNANSAIADILSDLKVTPVEKVILQREWNDIKTERDTLVTQATALGVSSTAYVNAYNAILNTVPRIETDILASPATTYTFTAANLNTFKTQWSAYRTQAELLRKAMTDKVQSNASAAQSTADTANGNVNEVLSDLKVTSSEKVILKREWEAVKAQNTPLVAQATALGVPSTTYTAAYNALVNTSPRIETDILSNMSTTYTFTTASRDTFNTQWTNYLSQAEALRKALTDKVQANAVAAQSTADNLKNVVVPQISERVSQAEQKITSEAITNTVTQSTKYQTDLNSKATPGDISGAINGLMIGTRNIMPNSGDFKDLSHWTGTTSIVQKDGFPTLHSTGTSYPHTNYVPIEPNTEYAFTMEAMLASDFNANTSVPNHIYVRKVSDNTSALSGGFTLLGGNRVLKANKWEKVTILFKTIDTDEPLHFKFHLFTSSISVDKWLKNIKLEKGNKPTDWTPSTEDVNLAISTARQEAANAQSTADGAVTSSDTANSLLTDIASDARLTASEKKAVKKEWDIIVSERATTVAQGTKYGSSTTAYTNAYNALNTYITPLLSNLNTTSVIVGTTFRTNFKNYYDAKVSLLKDITDRAKDLADGAQATANGAQTSANSAASAAVTAQTTANNAATAASNAATSATGANNLLADIASDSRLTASEKKSAKKEWDIIVSERASVVAQGDTYSISTTAYTNAYNALNTYITPLLANLNTTSVIVGTTFRNNFKNYYDAKIALLKLVTDKAKEIADIAQSTADTIRNTTIPVLTERVQQAESKITSESITNTVTSSSSWEIQTASISTAQTAANNAATAASNAQTAANNAATAASNAASSANTANNSIADIASDSKLTATEKKSIKKEWDIIVGERDSVVAQGAKYSISTAAYTNAYNALSTYITPMLTNLSTTTNIVGTTFRANFKAYYDAKIALLKLVTDKAKDLADAAQSTATSASTAASNAQTTANNAATAASNAASSATGANNLLADIASDARLTATEKKATKKEWDIIVGERASIVAQGATYSISTVAYTNAYNALNTYITPLLTNLNTTSVIVGTTFRTNFKNYYDAKIALLKLVTDAAKTLADAAQTAANTANTTANGLRDSTIPTLTGRINTAESKITDSAIINTVTQSSTYTDALTGKVSTNSIISSINQTAESIKIQASKINLVGAVTVLSDITGNLGTITAGTIEAANINTLLIRGTNSQIYFGSTGTNFDGRIDYADNSLRFQSDTSTYYKVNKGGTTGDSTGNVRILHQMYGAGFPMFHFGMDGSAFNHRILRGGNNISLKFLAGSVEQLQVRNSSDTHYRPVVASDFTVASKREFKKDIELAGDMSSVVASTPIFGYTLKTEDKKKIGFLWEESPACIREEESISQTNTIGVLWKAMQEQMARIDYLERELRRNNKGGVKK